MTRGRVLAFERRRPAVALDAALRRFRPARGCLLTLSVIRGPWRPSGAVGGAGVFAVVWETWSGSFWAALHDFAPADQLRLVESCRRLDAEAGYPGSPAERGR